MVSHLKTCSDSEVGPEGCMQMAARGRVLRAVPAAASAPETACLRALAGEERTAAPARRTPHAHARAQACPGPGQRVGLSRACAWLDRQACETGDFTVCQPLIAVGVQGWCHRTAPTGLVQAHISLVHNTVVLKASTLEVGVNHYFIISKEKKWSWDPVC